MQATGDWVVVKPIPENAEADGIILPEGTEAGLRMSEVAELVSFGDDCFAEALEGAKQVVIMRGVCFTMPKETDEGSEQLLCCKYNKLVAVI